MLVKAHTSEDEITGNHVLPDFAERERHAFEERRTVAKDRGVVKPQERLKQVPA
jgi:hypothetical protein